MKKLLCGLLGLAFLASCSSKKNFHQQNRQIEKIANKQTSDNSLQRFSTTCNMLTQIDVNTKQSLVPYAFDILNSVSQGTHTKWSIVYDISNKQIHFKTADFQQEKPYTFHS